MPSKARQLSAAKKAALVLTLASGATIEETAVLHEVPRNAVYNLVRYDPKFREMLEIAEDTAVNTILAEVQTVVRAQVKMLGPKAMEVIAKALDGEDGRSALQAAGIVLRGTGVLDGGKLDVRVGLEGAVGGAANFSD